MATECSLRCKCCLLVQSNTSLKQKKRSDVKVTTPILKFSQKKNQTKLMYSSHQIKKNACHTHKKIDLTGSKCKSNTSILFYFSSFIF